VPPAPARSFARQPPKSATLGWCGTLVGSALLQPVTWSSAGSLGGLGLWSVGGFGAVEGFAVPGLTVLVHCSEAVGMGFAGFAAAALDVRGLLLEVDRLGV
jgi:hypothetical protein